MEEPLRRAFVDVLNSTARTLDGFVSAAQFASARPSIDHEAQLNAARRRARALARLLRDIAQKLQSA